MCFDLVFHPIANDFVLPACLIHLFQAVEVIAEVGSVAVDAFGQLHDRHHVLVACRVFS